MINIIIIIRENGRFSYDYDYGFDNDYAAFLCSGNAKIITI